MRGAVGACRGGAVPSVNEMHASSATDLRMRSVPVGMVRFGAEMRSKELQKSVIGNALVVQRLYTEVGRRPDPCFVNVKKATPPRLKF